MHNGYILITGANGEIGHGLLKRLCEEGASGLVALDLKPLDPALQGLCADFVQGDVRDTEGLDQLAARFPFSTIYHLASVLSTRAERQPEAAHHVNVDGTLNLLGLAMRLAERRGAPVKFIYPSSIAVYGLPDLESKARLGAVTEEQCCLPTTMYGCNKLYCEHLGRYYSRYYRRLERGPDEPGVDFRALRFPGLISADTVPTGGTSDYGPEMLHHAAQGIPYVCFVRPDSALPFMAMPDAIASLLQLEAAPQQVLSRLVYNVGSFSLTAAEIQALVEEFFPEAQVSFEPHPGRQAIVDSWPADVDDRAARADWGWSPQYDQVAAFRDYLVPAITARYRTQNPSVKA
jgi:nucleoside-diphosphate-sugar epimerase